MAFQITYNRDFYRQGPNSIPEHPSFGLLYLLIFSFIMAFVDLHHETSPCGEANGSSASKNSHIL
jgi:hypothetical protein